MTNDQLISESSCSLDDDIELEGEEYSESAVTVQMPDNPIFFVVEIPMAGETIVNEFTDMSEVLQYVNNASSDIPVELLVFFGTRLNFLQQGSRTVSIITADGELLSVPSPPPANSSRSLWVGGEPPTFESPTISIDQNRDSEFDDWETEEEPDSEEEDEEEDD